MKRFMLMTLLITLTGCDGGSKEVSSACRSEMESLHRKEVCDAYRGLSENPDIYITPDLLTSQANKNAKAAYQFIGGSCGTYVPMTTSEAGNFLNQC